MLLRGLSNRDDIYYVKFEVVQDDGIYQEQHIITTFKIYFTVKKKKQKVGI